MKYFAISKHIVPLSYVCLGIAIIVWSDNTSDVFSKIFAIVTLVIALFKLISYCFTNVQDRLLHDANGFAVGLSLVVLGAFVWLKSDLLASIFPFILGFLITFKGIEGLQNTINLSKTGHGVSRFMLSSSLIIFTYGVFLMINPFGWEQLLYILLGAGLIIAGLVNFIINLRVSKVVKNAFSSKDAAAEQAAGQAAVQADTAQNDASTSSQAGADASQSEAEQTEA